VLTQDEGIFYLSYFEQAEKKDKIPRTREHKFKQ